jgi:anti-sigma B factor antagonist
MGARPIPMSPRILLIDAEEAAPGVTKVNLRGRLDAIGVQSVEATFGKMAQTQEQLIVDLSRVSFIASTGLRTLIAGARALAARGGRMVFLQPEPAVEGVLIKSGTDQVIPVFHTLADAICGVCAGEGDDEEFASRSLSFSLEIDRTQQGVARVGAWVDELAILLNLNQRTEYALRLCLEEAVTNIVMRATPPPGVPADRVVLRLVADREKLSLTLQDQCAPYNPLQPLPERQPGEVSEGGLGIGLMRQHARDVVWSRVGQWNRLALTIPR